MERLEDVTRTKTTGPVLSLGAHLRRRRPLSDFATLDLLRCTWTLKVEDVGRADVARIGQRMGIVAGEKSSHVAPESASRQPVRDCARRGRRESLVASLGARTGRTQFLLRACSLWVAPVRSTCLTCGKHSQRVCVCVCVLVALANFPPLLFTFLPATPICSANFAANELFICDTCRNCLITSDLPTISGAQESGCSRRLISRARRHRSGCATVQFDFDLCECADY